MEARDLWEMLQLFSQSAEFKCWKNDIQEKFASSQDAFDDVVKYFGENPKTTPPSVFFPVFVRFVKAYKVSRSLVSVKPSLALLLEWVPSSSCVWVSVAPQRPPLCLRAADMGGEDETAVSGPAPEALSPSCSLSLPGQLGAQPPNKSSWLPVGK